MPSLPSSFFWKDSFHKYFGEVQKITRVSYTSSTALSWHNLIPCIEILNPYCVASIVLPIITAFLVLLVPLSTSTQSDDVHEPLFVTFQCVYTIIGYPLMLFTFDFSIPGLTIYIKYILILCIGQVFIITYFTMY
eukprot:454342_1